MKAKTIICILFSALIFTACGKDYSELPNQFCSYYDAAGYEIPDFSQTTTFNHKVNDVVIVGNSGGFYKLKMCNSTKDAKDIYKHLENTDDPNFVVKHHKRDKKSYITMLDGDSCYIVFQYGSNILTCWDTKEGIGKSKQLFYDFLDTIAE